MKSWKLSKRRLRFSSLLIFTGTFPSLSAIAYIKPSIVLGWNKYNRKSAMDLIGGTFTSTWLLWHHLVNMGNFSSFTDRVEPLWGGSIHAATASEFPWSLTLARLARHEGQVAIVHVSLTVEQLEYFELWRLSRASCTMSMSSIVVHRESLTSRPPVWHNRGVRHRNQHYLASAGILKLL